MERQRLKADEEVFYDVRQHAAGIYSPDFFLEEGRSDLRSGLLLFYLTIQGAKQLKQKWNEYWRPRMSKRKMAIFVSPGAEHIALAIGNQVVILQKDDDYVEPCGTYACDDRLSFFTNGAWMEPQGILGIISDMGTLYLVNSSGGQIAKWTRSDLKLATPIVDLIVLADVKSKKSFMSSFGICTADGVIHRLEVSKDPGVCISSIMISDSLFKERLLQTISCVDFHPDLSLVVLLGAVNDSKNSRNSTGFYSLFVLRLCSNSNLELLFCTPQFEGLFSSAKGHVASLASPKLSISPHGKYIATLDLTGCVDVLDFDSTRSCLSMLCATSRLWSHSSEDPLLGRKNDLTDIVDLTWWSDHVLLLAHSSGCVILYDVLSDIAFHKEVPHFCMPVMERPKHSQGHVFVLNSSEIRQTENKQIDRKISLKKKQVDGAIINWSLVGIYKKSLLEMYSILISNEQYDAALEFADSHGLDRDEVFKAQWLRSTYGTKDVDMFLSHISDRMFVLSECIHKIGPSEEAVKALLSYGIHITEDFAFSNISNEESNLLWETRVTRLQLLQYRDKLETFVGINMGRFLAEEYGSFRVVPIAEAAASLAESGKIGALKLLFKRHPYSLSSVTLNVLSVIPETVPVQSYDQLLPGRTPPVAITLRERDWVECEDMVSFLDKMIGKPDWLTQVRTENMMKLSMGFGWPSITELIDWYKDRSLDIDRQSGQLENCLALVEVACRKGISELQHFLEDITYLHQLVYASECDEDFTLGLVEWEKLSAYEKFRMLLKGATEESAVEILREKAVPFMQNRGYPVQVDFIGQVNDEGSLLGHGRSFLVRWMKEIAADNNLEMCLKIIENGCGESPIIGLFKDEAEITDIALECIYSCVLTDQWNQMASILSKLPCKTLREKNPKDTNLKYDNLGSLTPRFFNIRNQLSKSLRHSNSANTDEEGSEHCYSEGTDMFDFTVADDSLEKRVKKAEGHIEAGRILEYYQVPKPICFFLSAESDEKTVKQLIRLLLSKFGRRQPGKSDGDWNGLWNDMLRLQEKAFPFLDSEYMLIEFCRGLLKAGKFSLARNYLKGAGSIALASEKADFLVVQAAREYFFSASSLTCPEIWKAKDCLNLCPNSKLVQSELDVIEALTVRLPNLGVTLLPMQFKQIRNHMEIIMMVISSQKGAYLNVEELIDVAKLLGLGSADDIAAVEEAAAREAAVAGDLQVASELCLVLAKKGHGAIWDLSVAIARGPNLDNIDTSSRKQLLGFALCHCDQESIGELLRAWKEVDMHMHYEQLMLLTKSCPPNFSSQGCSLVPLPCHSLQDILSLRETSEPSNDNHMEDETYQEVQFDSLKMVLSRVADECLNEGGISWESLLRENRKFLSFTALELPWLLELSSKVEYDRKAIPGAKSPPGKHCFSVRLQAVVNILKRLAVDEIAPSDELIILLAKSIMVSPVTEEDDVLGCSFLLNLVDALRGVEVIEEGLKQREIYHEIFSIMNIGMSYSSIQNLHKECSTPGQRRGLLFQKFREKYASLDSDEHIGEVQSTFWREWKEKLEDQKRLADQARALEETIPGVDTSRFFSGDIEYIRGVLFSFIDSVKLQKKHILREAVELATMYGLQRAEVLLRFFGCALVSQQWENDDIVTEIAEYREEIINCANDVIEMISTVVFPEIDGHNKRRLSFVYSILSVCHLHRRETDDPLLSLNHTMHKRIKPFRFCKILEQECQSVSSIKELNFKNIAGLEMLNYDNFNGEILSNVKDSTVESLAQMVRALLGLSFDANEKGLISWQDVYKHYVLTLLSSLESRTGENPQSRMLEELQVLLGNVEQNYDLCTKYIRALPEQDISYIIRRYQKLCISCISSEILTDDSALKSCVVMVLDFWVKLAEDFQASECCAASCEKPDISNEVGMSRFVNIFRKLVMEDEISGTEAWCTIVKYVNQDNGGVVSGLSRFIKAMIVSGCRFDLIASLYFKACIPSSSADEGEPKHLLALYTSLTQDVLSCIVYDSAERRNLHGLLSSLSKMEGSHREELKVIRSEVWTKLTEFSDKMQLENSIKVYALELMQTITGNKYKTPRELISEVKPWEDWDESLQSTSVQGADLSSSITSSIVALKSTRLIAKIMPEIRIVAEDLISIDSAINCFFSLSKTANSAADLDVLQAILEQWEMLFSSRQIEKEAASSPNESKWSNDDWDEGWETFPDDLANEEKEKESESINPFHACWMEIVKKLVIHGRPSAVMELLDQSLLKPGGLLLDEGEAKSLFEMLVKIDCFVAVKILLLLPYDAPRFQCLQAAELVLKERGVPSNHIVHEYELLTLVLSAEVMQIVIFNPAFGTFFSYMCYLVGHLARICQEELLKHTDGKGGSPDWCWSLLFGTLLLPCFIAELVLAKQCILAGFIVSQWMHTHPSIGLIDTVQASLHKYLEGQLLRVSNPMNGDLGASCTLHAAVSRLSSKLSNLLQSALSDLKPST